MKILQINTVYKEGSTGKIVYDLSADLRVMGHDVYTCYGIGQQPVDEYSRKICTQFEHVINAIWGRLWGIPFGGVYLSNRRIINVIKEFKPDIVHIHCINGYMVNVYRLLSYLAASQIKTVLTLHAEIFYTAGCGHAYECEKWKTSCYKCVNYKQAVGSWFFDRSKKSWMKMFNSVNSFRQDNLIVTAVSPWLTNRAKESSILNRFHIVGVNNGLDTSVFHYYDEHGIINRRAYERIVLFVTPYFGIENNDIKGGRFLIPISKALPNYLFIVVATKTAKSIGELPVNVQLWGRARSRKELALLYSAADLSLLLSRRETFSMVTAESLCCGTPVVGFKTGGAESIALVNYTDFVEYGNVRSLIDAIIRVSNLNINKNKIMIEAYKRFDSKQMSINYSNVYDELVKDVINSYPTNPLPVD